MRHEYYLCKYTLNSFQYHDYSGRQIHILKYNIRIIFNCKENEEQSLIKEIKNQETRKNLNDRWRGTRILC